MKYTMKRTLKRDLVQEHALLLNRWEIKTFISMKNVLYKRHASQMKVQDTVKCVYILA